MRNTPLCLFAVVFLAANAAMAADTNVLPFISPVFGDYMVLQRGKPNKIWGWAKPGEEVRVKVADAAAKTISQSDGRWQVALVGSLKNE